MKQYYESPEIALFRLSAAVLTSSQPDPEDWETEIIGSEDDYNANSDET